MKTLLVLAVFVINMNRIAELTTVSSSYDPAPNLGIKSSLNKSGEFQNKPSMLTCIVDCNRIQSCTVAVYSANAKTCQIYSLTIPIDICSFELSSTKDAAI